MKIHTMHRILLIDDDEQLGPPLATYFQRFELELVQALRPSEGLALLAQGGFDAAILDVMLPEMDGFALCRSIRRTSTIPLIMLTARGEEHDKIAGLEAGADDYLTKPFHPEELHLRVQSLLRRSKGQANQTTLKAAGLHLDEGRQCVTRDGADIQLTAAEFRLLRYFMLHPEQILSKSHLAEHLYDGETERDSNVLEVHVNHLRRKLGKSVIETRRGQGYLFGGQAS